MNDFIRSALDDASALRFIACELVIGLRLPFTSLQPQVRVTGCRSAVSVASERHRAINLRRRLEQEANRCCRACSQPTHSFNS